MNPMNRILLTATASLLAVASTAGSGIAQDTTRQERPQRQQQQCTVTVMPRPGQQNRDAQQARPTEGGEETGQPAARVPAVPSGQAAVGLEVRLTGDLREITEFAAAEGSGLRLASPDDISRTDMARRPEQTEEQGQQQKQSISMATDGSRRAIVWINTEEATPDTYAVSFRGSGGKCDAMIRVTEEEGQRSR